MSFGGTEQPAAYGELVSIGGLNPDVNKKLSAAVAAILETKLSVPKTRFFLKFYDTKVCDFGQRQTLFGEERRIQMSLHTKVLRFDLYRPIRAVHTGPTGHRYADHPLSGDTIEISRRRSFSTVGYRFRSSVVDFNPRWSIKGERRRERRKRERYLLFPDSTRDPSLASDPSPVGFLLRSGRRGEKGEGNSPCGNEATPRLFTFS
ncbi:hypothetical protein B296_00008805 [Ensete ventricosum]|uniref:Macrophage migration inhibitory factor n=1 Tax=Ensete ventricosum TaxID=4639 RepID=A0A426ZQX5_ENSVE|nr:hypothetical protein B296_00008805 [Ensete ventricosum]